jgi:hypothetical protein
LVFLESWASIVPEDDRVKVFKEVENRLNQQAQEQGELQLSVPFVCIDCIKPEA